MRRSSFVAVLAFALLVVLLSQGVTSLLAQPPGQPPPGQGPPPGMGGPGGPGMGRPPGGMMGMMPPDTAAAERDSLTDVVMKKIAGKEDAPAESVFKDIQVLKGMTAGHVVRIMNLGFGRSLGARCWFCHDRNDWAKSESKHKKTAREMWKMVGAINTDYIAKMEDVGEPGGQKPVVNCGTCHRGSTHVGGGGGPRRGEGPPGGGAR